MPPSKEPPSCLAPNCPVGVVKESVDKAEQFNQEYRLRVEEKLNDIGNNTGKIIEYIAKQEELNKRVDKHETSLEKLWTEVRARPSRKELLFTASAMVAILGLLITFVK